MLATRYQTDSLLGTLFFYGMVIVGICGGFDLFLAPKTSLVYRLGKEFRLPFVYLLTIRLTGLLWLLGSLVIGWLQLRSLLGYVP